MRPIWTVYHGLVPYSLGLLKIIIINFIFQATAHWYKYTNHRCRHQRTKKRDREDEKTGVSTFHTARGRNWYCCTPCRRYMDFTRATITRDIVIPGPTRPGLCHSGKSHNIFTILQSELALPSTGSWLPSRLSSTWRWTKCICSSSKYAKKRDILSEKRESGMALKSLSLRPKAVMLTPMTNTAW